MKYPQKEKLFAKFYSDWRDKFNQIPNIIKYISSYHQLAFKFEAFSINNTAERINNSQVEWVALVSQLVHPVEREFFKPYWVPLESDRYDLFIDLSSQTYTLFEVHYFPFEPYQWYKKVWFEDIGEFLAWATDPSIDIDNQLKINDKKCKKFEKELFKKRKELGLDNEYDNSSTDLDYILTESDNDEIEKNNSDYLNSNKPLYIYFCAGYPSAYVSYLTEAAKELDINLKIEYHGCIIRTLYKDEHGVEITDAQVRALEIEEKNKEVVECYSKYVGEDWLEKLKFRAIELFENKDDAGLPF